jgi:hypothetical protein
LQILFITIGPNLFKKDKRKEISPVSLQKNEAGSIEETGEANGKGGFLAH